MPRAVILAIVIAVSGCSDEPACIERDVQAATQSFAACVASKNYPGDCQHAAQKISCRRYEGRK